MANSKSNTEDTHSGGRPTKYTPDMPDRLEAYVRNCPDELPSKTGFATLVGVHENTIGNWGKKYPEFLWALRRLHTLQHAQLINRGLEGSYDAALAKLMLCSNHGYGGRRDADTDDNLVTAITVSARELRTGSGKCVH